jgi:glycosyltransferase involved in cell wall biosynthesis
VSLIEPGKNLEGVSRALALLKGNGLEVNLVVAGAPTAYLGCLQRLWRVLGLERQVQYLGPVPGEDLPHLYRLARVFLFASFYEGFGLPVVEALACGTPVVTSAASSCPEVAGDAALTVNPGRPEEIARAIEEVWRSGELRASLRERGLRRARQFSWGSTAAQTLEVYRAALGCASNALKDR